MKNRILKKSYTFFKSMKFGLILLGISGVIAAFGSLIPQGREVPFYFSRFSSTAAKLILLFKMDNIYQSPYFIILFSALCLNLFLCSISRIEILLKKIKTIPHVEGMEKLKSCSVKKSDLDKPGLFREYGFKKFSTMEIDDKKIYAGKKSAVGYLGSWLIHLGILLIILFYAYGQSTYFSTAVYGTAGTSSLIDGTDMKARINSFHIRHREDGSVEQYVTNLDLLDKDQVLLKSVDISVNNPLNYKGYSFYQTNTGWAAKISFLKNDTLLKEQLLYEGTVIEVPKENIAVQFTKFYPDFSVSENGLYSKSDVLNNPQMLYTLFYRDKRVGMNVITPGSQAAWNEYSFQFTEPQRYTYLQVNKMKGKLGALVGAFIMTAGLICAFYMKPRELVIIEEIDKIVIYGININESQVQNRNRMKHLPVLKKVLLYLGNTGLKKEEF